MGEQGVMRLGNVNGARSGKKYIGSLNMVAQGKNEKKSN